MLIRLCMGTIKFQSTLSSRRATSNAPVKQFRPPLFQSTLSSRRATSSVMAFPQNGQFQSTLSSRRATSTLGPKVPKTNLFQSTLSSRRATASLLAVSLTACDFNPRSPHGERRGNPGGGRPGADISIHALLTESDQSILYFSALMLSFQSTLSSRRATSFAICRSY